MKKGKLLAGLTAAFILCAAMLVGCGSSDNAGVPADSNTFVVGFDQSYPPYGFVGDDGQFTGFDLELAAEVCDRNGWTVKYEPIDWDAKDTLLKSGAITCIWNGFTLEGREDKYAFSDPYMLNGQVIVVKTDSGIKSVKDLQGKAVVTQVASAAWDVLQGDKADVAKTFGSLETRPEFNTAFMELESGAADAVACDLSIAEFQKAAKPGKYVVLNETLSDEHYAVAFAETNPEQAKVVTQTLKQMNDDGFIKDLCDKYSEYGISYDNWLVK